MKIILPLLIFLNANCFGQKAVVTIDISTFWNAYDKIVQTKDNQEQIELIKTLYLQKGSPGLAGIIQARRYKPEEYVHAINSYPEFWKSIRANTLKADYYADKIEAGIDKLRKLYPELKPATIYFTMGVLRTGGTTIEDRVLIGSEISMTDKKTNTSELDKDYSHLKPYFNTEPINSLDFLNVHEYIHTQQKTTIGNNLLAQTIIEGVAEFIAEKALGISSPNPQIQHGKKIDGQLKAAFLKEMFATNFRNWLWHAPDNEFGMRDLGYYIGYSICENYYRFAVDKNRAIKEMIQLDYNDEKSLFDFVDQSRYFNKNVKLLLAEFEQTRPKILSIEPFENGSQNVDPKTKLITLNFSKPMNINNRGFDYGPLGENNVLRAQKIIGFSQDRKSFTFEVNLDPDKPYQSVATDQFSDASNYPLKPYLIDLKTSR